MNPWSVEVGVALAPGPAYERLLAERMSVSGARALRRPLLILLVIATLVPIMAVQRVTIGLVASAALAWSFVVAIQGVLAAGVIASAPARRVEFSRALDLWFAGHLPYTLWMLALFGAMAIRRMSPLGFVIVSAVVPATWTAAIAVAFCHSVLGMDVARARRRAAVHFVAAWTIGLAYVVWAAGGTAGPLRALRDALGLLQ